MVINKNIKDMIQDFNNILKDLSKETDKTLEYLKKTNVHKNKKKFTT